MELGCGMDIAAFNLLFKLHNSSYMQLVSTDVTIYEARIIVLEVYSFIIRAYCNGSFSNPIAREC